MKYKKVRFVRGSEKTTGLIFSTDVLEEMTISEISRFFPYWESRKMFALEISPAYESQEAAFSHQF